MAKPKKSLKLNKQELMKEDMLQLSDEELGSFSAGGNTKLGVVGEAKGAGVLDDRDSESGLQITRLGRG